MVSSKLKKKFEEVVSSRVRLLTKIGITPNILTILGIIASIASSYFYINYQKDPWNLLYAGIFVLLSGFLDAIDGVLARATVKPSDFGGFFDSVADRYSDAIVLSGIAISGIVNPYLGFASLISSFMVSYARSRAEAEDVNMAGVGLAERAERMIIITLTSFASIYHMELMNWGIGILTILANITVLQRIYHFYKKINQ